MRAQVLLYSQLVKSNAVTSLLCSADGASYTTALSSIMAMRKLCAHPDLMYAGEDPEAAPEMEACLWPLYPHPYQLGQALHSGEPCVQEHVLSSAAPKTALSP
jgi:hypothetical protein